MLKTKYNTDKTKWENKIPNTSGLVKKPNYNTKTTRLENKIPDISNLATKASLTAVENKIPSISNLVKKTDYNMKITEIEKKITDHKHDEYIDTSKFDKLAANVFNARLAQANLIIKTDFDVKLSSLNRKITSNKTKHLLKRTWFKLFSRKKVILEKMVLKIIWHFNQCADILDWWPIHQILYRGKLRDYLMKVLPLLIQVFLLQIIM